MKDKREELLRCGYTLFAERGFKDTNVADITKMAGMATGTFYNYFISKDQLFMEIYLKENAKLKKSILESLDLDADPFPVMKKMMFLNLQGMQSNPILKEWYNREAFSRIEETFRKEKGIDSVDFLYDTFIEVVKKWQAAGKMRNDIDSGMIMAIFSALITVEVHKDEIGFQYFPEVLDYMSEFIMSGLTAGANQPKE